MKAAVITMQSVKNYGSQLQTLATQEKLRQYYDEVEIIDFRRKDTYGLGLIDTFAKGNLVKAMAVLPTVARWGKVFGKFQKENLNLSRKKYLSEKDFENFEDGNDVYFAGSDQVWNTGWNKGIIGPYYLDFVPEGRKKFSYASSFGKTDISKSEVETVREYLESFSAISVREESGKTTVEKQLGIKNVERIIDPTLVMPADFWRGKATGKKKSEPYILIYNLNRSKEFDEYARKLSGKTGLKLYRFCTRYDQIFRNGSSMVVPEVLDFVTAVDNARYVLTDSFHATAFAMNLGTEPICIYPEQYGGRLSEFLKLLDEEERHAEDYDDFEMLDHPTNFSKVEKILSAERKKVDDFLRKTVELAKK